MMILFNSLLYVTTWFAVWVSSLFELQSWYYDCTEHSEIAHWENNQNKYVSEDWKVSWLECKRHICLCMKIEKFC